MSAQVKIMPKFSQYAPESLERLDEKFAEARRLLGEDYICFNKKPPLSEREVEAVLENEGVV